MAGATQGQRHAPNFESFQLVDDSDSKGKFEYIQFQQVFLVLCFEREIVREQLGIVKNIVKKRQEFLNNYIIHLNHILYSVLNIT